MFKIGDEVRLIAEDLRVKDKFLYEVIKDTKTTYIVTEASTNYIRIEGATMNYWLIAENFELVKKPKVYTGTCSKWGLPIGTKVLCTKSNSSLFDMGSFYLVSENGIKYNKRNCAAEVSSEFMVAETQVVEEPSALVVDTVIDGSVLIDGTIYNNLNEGNEKMSEVEIKVKVPTAPFGVTVVRTVYNKNIDDLSEQELRSALNRVAQERKQLKELELGSIKAGTYHKKQLDALQAAHIAIVEALDSL